jgi:hypothetical protein
MSTQADVDRERRAAQHANRNRRSMNEVCFEALERALDALKRDDRKLAEREIEYVKDQLEKVT